MSNNSRTLFLTGSTGTLGKSVIKKILTETEDRLFLLIRRKKPLSHWDRARKILASCGLESYLGTRVQVLQGDITFPRLGLNDDDYALLTREVDEVHHMAAITALNGDEEDCNRINLGGTKEVLKMVEDIRQKGKLQRFFYFSTAYVAGSRQTYCAVEDSLPEKPAFANYYESSKNASETCVREAMKKGLPATIFRPSIVVGDSKTGEVSDFNVIYPFLRLFAHGILSKLPTRPENSFNVVPIDFVVNASMAIARQKSSIGKTFHLVTEEPPTIAMLVKLTREEYPEMPTMEMIDPDSFKEEQLDATGQMAYQMLQPYLGYLNDHLSFDAANTRKALEGTDISFPVTDYNFLKTLCRYAVDAGYLVLN